MLDEGRAPEEVLHDMIEEVKIPEGYYMANNRLVPSEALAQNAVRVLLQYIGDDPTRDGLLDTPQRVCKSLREMNAGMLLNPEKILGKQFELLHDEMVISRDIPFTSCCEHHMLPFSGTATVAYVPRVVTTETACKCVQNTTRCETSCPQCHGTSKVLGNTGKVVGLSKLARLVHCFARRLQVQERMTGEIADTIVKVLDPLGAACILRAEHSCMSCRGVNLSGTSFITSAMRGVLKENPAARAELLSLCNIGG